MVFDAWARWFSVIASDLISGNCFRVRRITGRSHFDDAAENSIPWRAIRFGAHGGGFLIAHYDLFLRIPMDAPAAQHQRHVSQVAESRGAVAQFQIAERAVA